MLLYILICQVRLKFNTCLIIDVKKRFYHGYSDIKLLIALKNVYYLFSKTVHAFEKKLNQILYNHSR